MQCRARNPDRGTGCGQSRSDDHSRSKQSRRRAVTPRVVRARGGRRKRAWARPPRCSVERGTPIGEPAASTEQGRRLPTLQAASPPSGDPQSRGARCGRRKRAWARPPRCSVERGTPIGEPAASTEQGRRPLTLQAASPPSGDPPSRGARCGRRKRAWARPPRCSVERGTPIGEPAATTEQGRRLPTQQSASPPRRDPPKWGARCGRRKRA